MKLTLEQKMRITNILYPWCVDNRAVAPYGIINVIDSVEDESSFSPEYASKQFKDHMENGDWGGYEDMIKRAVYKGEKE